MQHEALLITGGWGLVGSELDYNEKWAHKPYRKTVDVSFYLDLQDFAWTRQVKEVIHLAAKVGGVKGNNDNMLDFFQENLMMNANIIKLCAEQEQIKKATFMLSTCVFPEKVQYPVDETMLHQGEPHPTNYGYAYAKRMLEVGARALRQSGKQARCIIPCNIYGRYDKYDTTNGHVIPSLVAKCFHARQKGTDFVVWGSGNAEREFIYAEDIANAVKMIHEDTRDIPNTMIVSPCIQHKIGDIARLIADALDFKGRIVFDTSAPEGILRKPTINKLFMQTYPDFKFTSIEEGIRKTCEHFERENVHAHVATRG